ncbi:MAG: DUF4293 domain-containing protein [Chitinophagales bacterium]|nr:DUF4293 domain-containing protein [Chitinophagales bacterium]
MIQRIQTVFLLLSLALLIPLFFLPIWEAAGSYNQTGKMNVVEGGTHFFLIPILALLVIAHLITIFSYKRRNRQKQLCVGNIFLFIIFILAALLVLQLENQIFQRLNLREFRPAFILPLFGIIFNLFARNAIRKDESLLRSMDRLR